MKPSDARFWEANARSGKESVRKDSNDQQFATPVSEAINPEDYLEFVRTLAGQRIETQGGRSFFSVVVKNGRMTFIPEKTGKERNTNFRRVLANYDSIKSFTLRDYRGLTVNAPYHLPLIAMYLGRNTG